MLSMANYCRPFNVKPVDRVSTREETFQDLSLPIPGKDHLNVIHHTQGLVSPLPPGLTPDTVSIPDCVHIYDLST